MRYGARHQKFRLLPFLLSVLSGALLALDWPPVAGFPLLFVAFVPLLYLHDRLPPGKRGTLPYVAAAADLALLLWNAGATRLIYNAYFTSGIVINCLDVALFTVPWLLYAVSQPVFNRWQRYGLLVTAWMSLELLHYHWGLAFPLLTLGNGLAAAPAVAQWYEYTGVFGGSLWIWVTNVLLYEAGRAFFVERARRGVLLTKFAYALLWVLLPVGVSLGLFSSYQEKGQSVEVVAVHPNLDCRKERKTLGAEALVQVHWALTKKHLSNRTRCILWPENSFNLGWLEELPANPLVLALRDSLKKYPDARLITGAVLYERHLPGDTGPVPVNTQSLEVNARKIWYNTYNAAVQLNAGPEVQLRTKVHLVALEETTVYPPVVNLFRKFIPSLGGLFFPPGRSTSTCSTTGKPLPRSSVTNPFAATPSATSWGRAVTCCSSSSTKAGLMMTRRRRNSCSTPPCGPSKTAGALSGLPTRDSPVSLTSGGGLRRPSPTMPPPPCRAACGSTGKKLSTP